MTGVEQTALDTWNEDIVNHHTVRRKKTWTMQLNSIPLICPYGNLLFSISNSTIIYDKSFV